MFPSMPIYATHSFLTTLTWHEHYASAGVVTDDPLHKFIQK